MERTAVMIGVRRYALAQGTDVAGVKAAMQEAAQAGGAFVDVVVVGNVSVSVLVTAGVPILFDTEQVPEDERNTGDTEHPYYAPALPAADDYLDY